MGGYRGSKSHQRTRSAKLKIRSRGRAAGVGMAVGAFLAFGLTPLASAAVANADGLELILDPILNSLSGVDPTLGADVSTLMASFDPAFAGDAATAAGSATDSADVSNALSAASGSLPSLSSLVSTLQSDLNNDIYQPLLTAGENFINNSANASLLNAINAPFVELFGRDLIGNGITGDTANTSILGSSGNTTTLTDAMNVANQDDSGWMYWNSSLVIPNLDEPPTGSNVDTTTLTTLAQPYPQVIAGTPNAWSVTDGTFTFSYSTEMADGSGEFPAGATTTISVPAIEYPNGYQVDVTGGQVVSAPNAPELVIASDGGANTVTVTVTATAADGGAGAG